MWDGKDSLNLQDQRGVFARPRFGLRTSKADFFNALVGTV